MERSLYVPKVRDILVKDVLAIRPEFSIFDAIRVFNEHRISSAPVIENENEVIGLLSESDCIKCLSNCLYYDEVRNNSVRAIMSKNVYCVDEKWDIFELENFFVSKHIRSAPVIDLENHLIGFVARRDVLMALEECMKKRIEYKREIKQPLELNMRERIRMIVETR